jgi:lactoylglutathione lyase
MNIAITHVAVYATDLEKTRDYYMSFFGGKSNSLYQNTEGFSSYFISFNSGIRLEIMHHTELERQIVKDRVSGWNHVAFSVGSREKVIELTQNIIAAGYELYSPPRQTGDGYYESCVGDPDGNRVEITI